MIPNAANMSKLRNVNASTLCGLKKETTKHCEVRIMYYNNRRLNSNVNIHLINNYESDTYSLLAWDQHEAQLFKRIGGNAENSQNVDRVFGDANFVVNCCDVLSSPIN